MRTLSKIMGGNPLLVILRLAVISLIVGLILSALGLTPFDLYSKIANFFINIWNLGFDAIEAVLQYFVVGAMIVVPIWIIMRVLGSKGRSNDAF